MATDSRTDPSHDLPVSDTIVARVRRLHPEASTPPDGVVRHGLRGDAYFVPFVLGFEFDGARLYATDDGDVTVLGLGCSGGWHIPKKDLRLVNGQYAVVALRFFREMIRSERGINQGIVHGSILYRVWSGWHGRQLALGKGLDRLADEIVTPLLAAVETMGESVLAASADASALPEALSGVRVDAAAPAGRAGAEVEHGAIAAAGEKRA